MACAGGDHAQGWSPQAAGGWQPSTAWNRAAAVQGQGTGIKVARLPIGSVARAPKMGEPRGLTKAIVVAETG